MSEAAQAEPVDGRAARAQRTHDAIVGALVALLTEGQLEPSIGAIAARAGVSTRSIFGHFGDRETLLEAVAAQRAQHLRAVWGELPASDAPLAQRIDAFAAQRARIYELIAPVRRAALLAAPSSPVTAKRIEDFRALKRHEAAALFEAELDGDAARTAALTALASFTAWEALRRHQDLDVGAATAALRAGLEALLRAPSPSLAPRRAPGPARPTPAARS